MLHRGVYSHQCYSHLVDVVNVTIYNQVDVAWNSRDQHPGVCSIQFCLHPSRLTCIETALQS